VLRVFAQVVRRSTRANDIVGRLGGEEFAAIVAAPMEIAVRIGERIRRGFESAGATVAGHAVGATVSIGAASAHELVTNIDALIARADSALYDAKGGGRNRLHAADAAAAGAPARLVTAAQSEAGPSPGLPRRKSAA
jgi:diguanylate cyclase (GGDEF)-like protein